MLEICGSTGRPPRPSLARPRRRRLRARRPAMPISIGACWRRPGCHFTPPGPTPPVAYGWRSSFALGPSLGPPVAHATTRTRLQDSMPGPMHVAPPGRAGSDGVPRPRGCEKSATRGAEPPEAVIADAVRRRDGVLAAQTRRQAIEKRVALGDDVVAVLGVEELDREAELERLERRDPQREERLAVRAGGRSPPTRRRYLRPPWGSRRAAPRATRAARSRQSRRSSDGDVAGKP